LAFTSNWYDTLLLKDKTRAGPAIFGFFLAMLGLIIATGSSNLGDWLGFLMCLISFILLIISRRPQKELGFPQDALKKYEKQIFEMEVTTGLPKDFVSQIVLLDYGIEASVIIVKGDTIFTRIALAFAISATVITFLDAILVE
jgi:hypothetical protein